MADLYLLASPPAHCHVYRVVTMVGLGMQIQMTWATHRSVVLLHLITTIRTPTILLGRAPATTKTIISISTECSRLSGSSHRYKHSNYAQLAQGTYSSPYNNSDSDTHPSVTPQAKTYVIISTSAEGGRGRARHPRQTYLGCAQLAQSSDSAPRRQFRRRYIFLGRTCRRRPRPILLRRLLSQAATASRQILPYAFADTVPSGSLPSAIT